MSMSNDTVTLNIGLNNNPVMANMTAQQIADFIVPELQKHAGHYAPFPGAHVAALIVRDDENTNVTEPTAVISYYAQNLDRALFGDAVGALSVELGQDCIAAWVDSDARSSYGFLAGPKAEAWGPFDEGKFEIGSANLMSWTISQAPVREVQ